MKEIIREYLYDIEMLCESDITQEQLVEKKRKQMVKGLLAIVKNMMMSDDFNGSMDDWRELAEEINEVEGKAIVRFKIYKED